MAFKVTDKVWLAEETARIKDIILMPKYWHQKWTDKKLRKELADIGLDYSEEDIKVLNDALHADGIVEDVLETDPVTPVVPDVL